MNFSLLSWFIFFLLSFVLQPCSATRLQKTSYKSTLYYLCFSLLCFFVVFFRLFFKVFHLLRKSLDRSFCLCYCPFLRWGWGGMAGNKCKKRLQHLHARIYRMLLCFYKDDEGYTRNPPKKPATLLFCSFVG